MASERSDGDARNSLALWLRAGRAHRGMSLDDVARVTKIQPRILERLEAGNLDGLPAAVFVRGFVRSFARCVGLDEGEALRRYAACAIGSQDLTPTVRALVEVMADLAPGSATAARATPRKMDAVEVFDLAAGSIVRPPLAADEVAASSASAPVAPTPQAANHAKKKHRGRRRKARVMAAADRAADAPVTSAPGLAREACALGTPPSASPVVATIAADAAAVEAVDAAPTPAENVASPSVERAASPLLEPAAPPLPPMSTSADSAEAAAVPTVIAAQPSVPWRRPMRIATVMPAAAPSPSLVIDDADPDSAERVLEARAETMAPRRSLLPPILLDREDRSARQGGLTLAVILLLIAATLTLSYLMRRPSASGDGMTLRETPSLRG